MTHVHAFTCVGSQLKEPKDLLTIKFLCTLPTLKMYHIKHLNDINIIFSTLCSFAHEFPSYEFEVISLCCECPFAYAKDLLTSAKNNNKI